MKVDDILYGMQRSALAYQDIQPALPEGRLTVIDDEKSGVQCYLRQIGDVLSITFRGSDSAKDWATDLTFWKKVLPYGNTDSKIKVHTGFINAYKSPDVRERIQAAITPSIYTIQICGHSYGAALAVLCAVDLQYNFPNRLYQVLLFGCPRVGNRAFQRSYDKRLFQTLRVQNGNDIVTKLPLAVWGYRHVGARVHLGVPRLPLLFSRRQHSLKSYYESLFAKLL